MTYHSRVFRGSVMSGAGSVGYLSGVNDKVDKGDEVVLRFTPGAGVNASKGERLAYKLKQLVIETGHFKTPEYAAWGSGTNRGLLVVRADTKSDNYTLQQIANFMPAIARKASQALGMPVTFASASNEDGDEAFAQTSGGGGSSTVHTGPLQGLTGDQIAQYTLLSRSVDQNLQQVARIFGTRKPELSFKEICEFNFRTLVHSSAPLRLLRSLLLYANAQNVKSLATLPSLMRGKNEGSSQAAQLLEKSLRDLRESSDGIATVCAKFIEYLPSMSGLAGGGLGEIATATVIAGLTAGQIIAIVAGILAVIVTISLLLVAIKGNEEATLDWCKAREEATGVKCTPEDFEEHFNRQPPDARAALANALDEIGKGVSNAAKILLVGASVLGVGYIGYKLFSGTDMMSGLGARASAVRTRIKTSISAVRDRARARSGGSAPRALPASVDYSEA